MDSQNEIFERLFDTAETETASISLFDQLMKVDLRYLRLNEVGRGAMKEIIRTEDRKTGRLVAMAVLKNNEDSKVLESFLREARINAKLQHPNIVPVYDIDVDENQRPYFTMKLLPGASLKDIIKNLKSGNDETLKQYPLSVLVDIFLKVCEAIAYAHSQGICHLDLKPDNIRVSNYGEVMVCDWGLANFIGEENDDAKKNNESEDKSFLHYNSRYKTLQGEIKGTPGYMAPEQASGKREIKDQRTDIFALGCILYEILSHCEAINGENLEEILKNTCHKSPLSPSTRCPAFGIPESLEAVCMKAVKINASERYALVEEIIGEIAAYRDGFATKAEEASIFKQLGLLFRRNKAFCFSVLIFLSILTGLTVDFINNISAKEQLAVEALHKIKIQRRAIFKTLKKLGEAQDFKEKIGRDSAITFAEKAIIEFKKENKKTALDFAQVALLLDKKNMSANITVAKINMSKKQYESALLLLETDVLEESDQDLLKFCKAVIDFKSRQEITYQSMYELLKKNIYSFRTPFINSMLQPYLQPFDNIELLKEKLTWLLKAQNNLDELKFNLIYKAKKFSVDLSNNPNLKDIFFLRMLPVNELNISNSSFDNTKLLSEMNLKILHINSTPVDSLRFIKNMKELHISKGAFSQADLKKLPKKLKIIESNN